MPLSQICGPHGAVPIAPHRGFVTFDYNQANHQAFQNQQVGQVQGAPPGVCLALTMEWMHNWRGQKIAFNTWVNQNAQQSVNSHTVAVFNAGARWVQVVDNIMVGLGFTSMGHQNGPPWANLPLVVGAATYTILVYPNHAVGLFHVGAAVYFFDSDEGEAYFSTVGGFAQWFPLYLQHRLGAQAAPALYRFQYT